MIIDLPETTTSAINRKLIDLRESGGAIALGRVMTLVIQTEDGLAEQAIGAANDASREHPCRVLTVVRGNRRGASRLDGQIRVGGDAGASEVIVLRLYGPLSEHGDSVVVPLLLPDAPVVAWWPCTPPDSSSEDAIGHMAQRRITDSTQARSPLKSLLQRAARHVPGDTDLAWTRTTLWRALLAAALDEPPYEPVTSAVVSGAPESPSTDLLAAWLALSLRCPVRRTRTSTGSGLVGVVLDRASGPVSLVRPDRSVATLTLPGQPARRIALPPRPDRDCLSEELRRLDPDDVFGDVLTKGLAMLGHTVGGSSSPSAAAGSRAPTGTRAPTGSGAPGRRRGPDANAVS